MNAAPDAVGFWGRRSARERRVLAFGAAAVALLAGYGWVWRPMAADLARMDEQLPRLRAQAAHIEQAAAQLATLRAKPPAGTVDAARMADVLGRAAADAGLANGKFAWDAGERRARASFERVGFDAWTAWVDGLHRTHRIVLAGARVQSLGTPGWVRVECEFVPAADGP